MARIEVRMPDEANEGTEASVGKWLKQVGDVIAQHEPLVEINTDKVTIEVAAPSSGTVAEISRRAGDVVAPGDLLGWIESATSNQQGAATPERGAQSIPERGTQSVAAPQLQDGEYSPAVRRLLQEHNLQGQDVPRTNPKGRLSIAEVESFVATTSVRATEEKDEAATTGRKVPHTPMRKSIAAHMTRSVQIAPHVTSVFEADLSAVINDRLTRKEAADEEVPSVTAYLIHAAVQAIRQVPEVNSKWHDSFLEVFDHVNFGVGTATDSGGLVVPVIRDAHTMDLQTISKSLRELTQKARSGKLTQHDMSGGTFTLSNHGVSGSLLAAPIILPHGQAAILGAGKLQKRVVVCDNGGRDLFRVRPMMYVTLTVDHRVLDAQQTNAFLTAFVSALQSPAAATRKNASERPTGSN